MDEHPQGGFHGLLEVIPTRADIVLDLIRANSLWPLLSGLSCCAIEMMSTATSKNDIDRFGMFPFRASPRQADVLIVAGTLTTKMAGPAGPPLGADAGAEVVRGDGHLHHLRRPLQAQLQRGAGRRPGDAGGRLRARLPAPPGGPDLRDDEAPGAGQAAPRRVVDLRRSRRAAASTGKETCADRTGQGGSPGPAPARSLPGPGGRDCGPTRTRSRSPSRATATSPCSRCSATIPSSTSSTWPMPPPSTTARPSTSRWSTTSTRTATPPGSASAPA